MPRYFFHVHDGHDQPDLTGTLLDGLDEARTEAVRYAAELLRESATQFWADEEWTMTVTDDRQLTLFSLTIIGNSAPSTAQHPQPMPPIPA